MAAQRGGALLLKVDISGTMTTIGGLRSTSITLNDEAVDITSKDDGQTRKLLAQAGTSSVSVSGSGVFTDSTAETTIRTAFNASTFKSYNIIIPDLGTYAGTFMIASLEYSGEYNGEVTYSITLESSGSITFSSA
jgi:TP901-1 family phage major tail protein